MTLAATRRTVLGGLAGTAAAGAGGLGYAFEIEPASLGVVRYRVQPARAPWPAELRLRIAALADIHAREPSMDVARIRGIVARTNRLGADLVVLLGDYVAGRGPATRIVPPEEWAPALGGLRAPLGVFAVLGNHDWWSDPAAQARGDGPTLAGLALERAGIRVLDNEAVPLPVPGGPVWLAGLGDQIAFRPPGGPVRGRDDLRATLAPVPEGAPAILLAHEPDVFPRVPARVALTLAGHTHGGQFRVFGTSPFARSPFGNRYAYGHVREHADLVVSGGLGWSERPARFGVPPEIVLADVAGAAA